MRWRTTAVNIVRNIGIMLGLAVLSFVIGFFGLAKLLPASQTPLKPSVQIAANNVTQVPNRTVSIDTPVKTKTPEAPARAITQPAGSAPPVKTVPEKTTPVRGPVLDASDNSGNSIPSAPADTQKPRNLDGATSQTPTPTPATSVSGGVNPPGTIEQQPRKRRRHKKRILSTPTDTASADSEKTNSEESVTTNPDSAPDESSSEESKPRERTSLYKVHLGAYQSKEAANRQREVAKEKGFDTQVLPVTRNGRTMYRVQLGAYKDRDRANTAKQSLDDAGLSGKVTE